MIKNSNKINTTYINQVFFLCLLIHSAYGIIQYVSLPGNKFITGTFDNPAGFAVCIIAGIPFCLETLKTCKKHRYPDYIGLFIIILSLILSGSRTAYISLLSILAGYCYINYPNLIHKYIKTIAVTSFITIIPLLIFIFFLKRDSAIGRLLIWSNSLNMIKDKPLIGFGTNGFSAEYMLYQAKHFVNNPDSKFSMLADNVSYPFNEYIQLIIEYGFVGLFLLLIIYTFTVRYLSKKTVFPYFSSLMAISIFALFSYPFRYSFVVITFVYCLAMIAKEAPIKFKITIPSFSRWIFSFILLCSGYICIKEIYLEYRWKELSNTALVTSDLTILEKYDQLYNNWDSNPLFLYNYGAILNQKREYKKSISILNQCIYKFNDYDIQILLGDNYFKTKEWEKAKEHYLLASQMCPVRFIPLYHLSNIYDSINQPDQALKFAEQIIEKPVKVPSLTIRQIKNEMEARIQNHSSYKSKPPSSSHPGQ